MLLLLYDCYAGFALLQYYTKAQLMNTELILRQRNRQRRRQSRRRSEMEGEQKSDKGRADLIDSVSQPPVALLICRSVI